MYVKGFGSKYHFSTIVFTRSEQDHNVVRFAEAMHPRFARVLNRSKKNHKMVFFARSKPPRLARRFTRSE